MAVNPEIQGRVFPATAPYLVGREKVREFARAVFSANPLNHDVFAAQAAEHQWIADVFELEAGAHGVRSLGPGKRIGPLGLVGWSEGRVEAATDGKRASDVHDWGLRISTAGGPVATSGRDQWLQTDLLGRVGQSVAPVLNDPLERAARLVDDRTAQDGGQPEDG